MQIVKFGTKWCGPCKMLDPVLALIADEFPEVSITEFDVDEIDREVTESWGVRGVPATFVLDDDGNRVATITGAQPARIFREILAESN